MNFTGLGMHGLHSLVPLVERLVWPLPVIKTKLIEETSGQIDSYSEEKEEEFKYVMKQEVVNEEDPLSSWIKKPEQVEKQEEDEADPLVSVKEEEDEFLGFQPTGTEDVTPAMKILSHHQNKGLFFPCTKCDVACTSSEYLEEHSKLCRGVKKFVRVVPENVPSDLRRLARFVNGQQFFFCKFCEYKTDQSGRLKRHLVSHTGVKPYVCDTCGKRFTQSHHLKAHKLTHTGEKQYKCSDCDFATHIIFNLKKHVLTHMDVKRYACSMCAFKSNDTSQLKRHMVTHTGDRLFACTWCEYRAPQRATLNKHVKRKHTKDRPFSCTHCRYKAALKDSLKAHMKKHTEDEQFVCEECSYTTTIKRNMAQHMKQRHAKEKPFSCEQGCLQE